VFKWIRRLLLLVVVLWIVGEILLIPFAESRIEREVAQRTRDTAGVNADIDSFPMAAGVLVTGKVRELTVTLHRVSRLSVNFASVAFSVSGIAVDRPAILQGRAKIRSIDSGTVTARLELGALGRLASLAGVDVRVEGRTLRAGPVSVQIAQELVPCDPQARVEDEVVILTCTITELPEILQGLSAPLLERSR
jgi:hypothetical protein